MWFTCDVTPIFVANDNGCFLDQVSCGWSGYVMRIVLRRIVGLLNASSVRWKWWERGWRWELAVFLWAGDQKMRLLGIRHEPFHVTWQSAHVGPKTIINQFFWTATSPSHRMCHWEQRKWTIIFNRFWTGIRKDKVVIELNYTKFKL